MFFIFLAFDIRTVPAKTVNIFLHFYSTVSEFLKTSTLTIHIYTGFTLYVHKTIECSFKFLLKVGIEELIVNAPLVNLQSKTTNNEKSEVGFKQLIRDLLICNPWCVHNQLFNAYLEGKFK
jgi:hypothetical protein